MRCSFACLFIRRAHLRPSEHQLVHAPNVKARKDPYEVQKSSPRLLYARPYPRHNQRMFAELGESEALNRSDTSTVYLDVLVSATYTTTAHFILQLIGFYHLKLY